MLNIELNKVLNRTKKIGKAYRSLNYKQRRIIITSVIAFVMLMALFIKFSSSSKIVKPYGAVGLVVNGTVVETKHPPILSGAVPLVSFDDVKQYVDKNIYYDDKNKKAIITTPDKVIRIKADKTTGFANNKPFALNVAMKVENGVAYIPISQFKDVYDINVNYNSTFNVVIIDTKEIITRSGFTIGDFKLKKSSSSKSETVKKVDESQEITIAAEMGDWREIKIGETVGYVNKKYICEDSIQTKSGIAKKDNVAVRSMATIKKPIFEKVKKGETLAIYGEIDNWYKVRTVNGVVGFVKKKELTKITPVAKPAANKSTHIAWKPQAGKINMVWDQFENSTPSMNNVDKIQGLDVVSPTWFEVIDSNGRIKNKASAQYITWARGNGYKVWATVSNGVAQSKMKMTSTLLNNSDARENTINEVLALAQTYGVDGLNIDFEYMNAKDKDLFTQFMREIAPLCRDKGLTLSVDVAVYAESDNSKSLDRKALAQIVDYVVVMAYDQHWENSKESGSVAEYQWVESNLKSMLDEVPNDKLILGMPFYTRQWKEINGKITSTSLSMANTQNVIRQNNAKVKWDGDSGQYYAEFSKNNAKYKIWVEDVTSINLKSALALKYNLVGTSGWRRGYESYDVWEILNKNLKGYDSYDKWKASNGMN